MPVEAQTVEYSYVGDGATTEFPFPSRFLAAEDLYVALNGMLQVGGYTVTGAGSDNGGAVSFAVAPASAVRVVLIRNPPISQLLDFENGQTVLENTLDNGLDKLTMIAQFMLRRSSRSLRLSDFDATTALSPIPDATGRANRLLAFDGDGDPVMAAAVGDVATVVASQAEAVAGTDNFKMMTALRTKQAVDGRLASQAEAVAGTDNVKLMTPLRVAQAMAATGAGALVYSPDRASAVAAAYGAAVKSIMLGGRTAENDQGGGEYRRMASAPGVAKPWHFQSADGAWWKLTTAVAVPEQFGQIGRATSFDDAPAIQAAIDYANAEPLCGTVRLVVGQGNYHILTDLAMKSNVRVEAERGAVLFTSSTSIAQCFGATSITNFELVGLDIRGPYYNVAYPGGTSNSSGMTFFTCTDALIANNKVEGFLGNGINLNFGCADIDVDNNKVKNCRVGVSVFKGCEDIRVRSNRILNCHDIGINVDDATSTDTSGTAWSCSRVLVEGNYIAFVGYNAGADGISAQGSNYIFIIGNHVVSCGKGPTTWVSCRGITVNSGQGGFNTAAYCLVMGNSVNDCTATGIQVGQSTGTRVIGNAVVDNYQWPSALTVTGEVEVLAEANFTLVENNSLYITKSGSSRSDRCLTNSGSRTGIAGNFYQNALPAETVVNNSQADWLGVDQMDSLPAGGVQAGRVAMNRATGVLHGHNGSAWVACY